MAEKYLFYVFVVLVSVSLLIFSLNTKDRSYAVIAEVEAQKTAISFHRPVRVKALNVKPGQHVKTGDVLLEVERPDLLFDIEKIRNKQNQLESSVQKLQIDYETRQRVESLKHQQKIAEIDGQIMELESQYASESMFYSEVSEWAGIDTIANGKTLTDIKRNNLEKEKKLEVKRFISEKDRQTLLYTKDRQSYQLKKHLLDTEMTSLLDEQKSLIQYAVFDGTIGAVTVQLNELIPPYQTIISVYDENPNLIKAYMNELAEIPLLVGDKVRVESINRSYQIEGEIIEIGSRIVSYPKQMNPQGRIQMWGKEIFIQIPRENRFLNGEKVYVIINP